MKVVTTVKKGWAAQSNSIQPQIPRRGARRADEAEIGSAGAVFIEVRGPPPLTPPHKGEEELPRAQARFRGGGLGDEGADPPPPCGEGSGVGVPCARIGG